MDTLKNINYKSSSMAYATQQEIKLIEEIVPLLFTDNLSIKLLYVGGYD